MSSVDGDAKSLLDTTADYVSSKLFGPIDAMGDIDDNTDEDNSRNDYDDGGDESTISDVILSSDIQVGSNTTENGVNIARNGSLHMIASTLAKIAHVKSTKSKNGEDGLLGGTVGTQFESLPGVNGPDLMDHIVVDDGKQISIHAIRKTSAEQVGESKEKLLETTTIDPSSKQHNLENMYDDYEPTVIEDCSEKSSHLDQPPSFTDCICPFTASYPESETVSHNDPTKEDAAPFDEAILPSVDTESTVTLERKDNEINAPDECEPAVSQQEIQTAQFDDDTAKEMEQVVTSKTAAGFAKVESTAENSILEETPVTRPFSFLSYIVPLSPIPSIHHIEDAAEDVKQITVNELEESNLEVNDKNGDSEVMVHDNDICTNKPVNPPAKWSIFTPFITSYLDSNSNTDIHGKDPVGSQLTVKNEIPGEDKDVENGVDPIGSGPILFTNSIDKSITPPWDREDPPTTTNSTTASTSPTCKTTNHVARIISPDVEIPISNDQNEQIANQDIDIIAEPIEDVDDVECTMKGPVERIVPTTSASNSTSTQSASKGANKMTGKYYRCQRIVVLMLLLLGALSAGVYYVTQNQAKKSSRVVSASQVDDSASGNNNTTTSTTTNTNVPIYSPTVVPTEAPVKKVSLRPTKAPTKQPIASPSSQPSSSSTDDDSTLNDDDDANVGDGDDNNNTGDDDANNVDDDNVGDDDNAVATDDDGNNDDDSN